MLFFRMKVSREGMVNCVLCMCAGGDETGGCGGIMGRWVDGSCALRVIDPFEELR